MFSRGTMVEDAGVEEARRSRMEHEHKPSVRVACDEHAAQVEAEHRDDVQVSTTDVAMCSSGLFTLDKKDLRSRHVLRRQAFDSLCGRLDLPRGGSSYLAGCWPELRAKNVNNWLEHRTGEEEKRLVARTRLTRHQEVGREIYGFVSERYQPLDVDVISRSIADAAPADAKATIDYDGERCRWEVMFQSDVRPEDYVAGEFFKAGVLISTRDDGGSSVHVDSVVWQNLCLNLIIIDRATVEIDRIMHVGAELDERFREAFAAALGSIDHFVAQWSTASKDLVGESLSEEERRLPARLLLGGMFNGQMGRELVPVPSRRQRRQVVERLIDLHTFDQSAAGLKAFEQGPNRASIVNAFTRYAHEVEQDPWVQDEIQRGAGRLLASKRPMQFAQLEGLTA
jgi:hypothetical protein